MWRLLEHSRNTSATSEAPLTSFILGAHKWTIDNDNIGCSTQGGANLYTMFHMQKLLIRLFSCG